MDAVRRKLRRSLALVYLFAALALFAPWIANDLPLYIRGNSRGPPFCKKSQNGNPAATARDFRGR